MTALGSLVGLVLLTAVTLAIMGVTWDDVRHWGTPRNEINDGGEPIRVPLPPPHHGRILPPVPVETEGDYAFMFTDRGEPVRYDPCQPIRYVISPEGGVPGGEDLIHDAVARVSEATGLAFVYDGETDEPADFERRLFQPERYGEGFAPVVIGWSDEEANPELAGTVSGIGGSTSVTGAYGPQRFLVAGVVVLDADNIRELLTSGERRAVARAVVMHEVAHVVGLAHVEDPDELMHESTSWRSDWGPGDRAGLAIAGAGVCQER